MTPAPEPRARDLSNYAELNPGWDIFNDPLNQGSKVNWSVPGPGRLEVTFKLLGVRPHHEYTVGAHFFSAGTAVNFGAGKELAGSTITRDGVTCEVAGWDFGFLRTDSAGNGDSHFLLTPNSGTYKVQFSVRIGGAPGCPQTNCSVVYRTGKVYALETVEIIIP